MCLLLWRPVAAWVSQRQMDARIESAREGVAASLGADGSGWGDSPSDPSADPAAVSDSSASSDASAAAAAADTADADDPLAALYARFEEYNASVRAGTAGAVNDPFASSDPSTLFGQLSEGPVGSVSIPAIGVSLPLYLGATAQNLSLGACVVAGTSVPVGGSGTNCVVAAHRGWYGSPMFRDLEELSPGDEVVVENPWGTLRYRVVSMQVVGPSDVTACAVQEGRDLLTLLTCHPYGTVPAPTRLLVTCERVAEEASGTAPADGAAVLAVSADLAASASAELADAGEGEGAAAASAVEPSALLRLEDALALAGWAFVALCAVLALARLVRRRLRRAQKRGAHDASDTGRTPRPR